MRWISDPTRRFSRRPVYERDEMEWECSSLIAKFGETYEAPVAFPLSTEVLEKIVESLTGDLDAAGDLSWLGSDVEGATAFSLGKKPSVMISERLLANERRRRMTIAHELGHVHFHAALYQVDYAFELFQKLLTPEPIYCRRAGISRGAGDWMEWQASYAGGAILMPKERVWAEVNALRHGGRISTPITPIQEDTDEARAAAQHLAAAFNVSEDAALVRLSQLGHIQPRGMLVFPSIDHHALNPST
jgi:Zn-dependent peptidase ImmA (M78 family)